MSARMRRGLIYNNQTLLVTFFMIILGALFLYGMIGANPLFWLLVFLAIATPLIYPINVNGSVNVATLLNSMVGAIAIFATSASLGYESHAHYFFLALILSTFLNTYSSTRIILVQIAIVIGLFFYLLANDFNLVGETLIPDEMLIFQQTFVFLNSILIITLLAYMYRVLYVRNLNLLTNYSDNTKELLRVTNRQMTELDNNRRLLEAIYDNIDCAIILEDLRTNVIVDCNARTLQIFEVEKEEIIGKSDFQFFKDLKAEDTSQMIRELSEKEVWVGQEKLRTPKGKEFWSNLKLVHFGMDLRSYRMWTISDISIIMDANETLEAQNEELNLLNEELDSFVYSVAHDMRAPLTTLSSLVKLSREAKTQEKRDSYYKMKGQLIERMESYISDVVNYSRNQRTEVQQEVIDFKHLIHDIGAQFNLLDSEKYEFSAEVEEALEFKSDAFRLKVILSNLITNAVRYAKPLETNSKIALRVFRKGDELKIEVEDNGRGIPKEHQQEIFKMFYRADTDSSGSGLGLYIVKESLAKIGGDITLESEPGEGTTFHISIPYPSK